MIPKIIHYCWFSNDPIPQRSLDCIASWKELMPDYEIRLWDGNSFDFDSLPWTKQAVSVRKWAFAADYVRFYALYHHGGIYLDTDVRAIKRFDAFLSDHAFTSTEYFADICLDPDRDPSDFRAGIKVEGAIFGAEKGSPVVKEFMDYYASRDFILPGGKYDYRILPDILAEISERHGFKYDKDLDQTLDNGLHLYPYDYFTTQSGKKIFRDWSVTHNTVAIHLYTGSWRPPYPLHSRYTEWREATERYLETLWYHVILRKRKADKK